MLRLVRLLATLLLVVGACAGDGRGSPPASQASPAPGPTGAEPSAPLPTRGGLSGFLTREGAELLLNDEPFREISFDKFDLLQQFAAPPTAGWGDNGPNGASAARVALRLLGARGFRVVRVNASPFYPTWFNEAFFDDDPAGQAQKRESFFAGFDTMLDACDEQGIRVVASLLWNWENLADLGHHSLQEGLENRRSPGRVRVEEYVSEVVTRYSERPTIAMWEIGNEWNLGADIQFPDGIIKGEPAGDDLHPGPVVRDARNNYTSDQLGAFYREIATLIRSLDDRHLITTGDSAPRPAAMHLLKAVRQGAAVDWTFDSSDDLVDYLRLVNPDPIDVISIHYYDDAMTSLGGILGSPDNLRFFAGAAEAIGKPLFVGEIGLTAEARRYEEAPALAMLRATLPVIEELGLPLTLYWTFNDDRNVGTDEWLRYGRTDEALRLIEEASARLRQ